MMYNQMENVNVKVGMIKKKNQLGILELKSTVTERKNSLEISRF